MMRAYKNDFNQPQAPRLYDDPGRIATMLEPPPAAQGDDKEEMADKTQKPAAQQQGRQPGQQPPGGAAAGRPGQQQPAQPGATVIRERDLDRGNPSGQALPQGANRGQQPPRGLREWNRPDPTIQEIPNGPVDTEDESVQPAPVITPPPGGVYYRPGVQSTGRLGLRIAPAPSSRHGR
jgi:hypothetical protein